MMGPNGDLFTPLIITAAIFGLLTVGFFIAGLVSFVRQNKVAIPAAPQTPTEKAETSLILFLKTQIPTGVCLIVALCSFAGAILDLLIRTPT